MNAWRPTSVSQRYCIENSSDYLIKIGTNLFLKQGSLYCVEIEKLFSFPIYKAKILAKYLSRACDCRATVVRPSFAESNLKLMQLE